MDTAPVGRPIAEMAERARQSARIVGVDVARCLALIGMMSTHILPGVSPVTGEVTWHQQLAGGRSAALFALLAGVSLALVTGRQQPFRGRPMAAARVGIAIRAGLIALIGLILGGLESHVAVILTYYGVLFVLALPFLGLGWKPLAILAGGWAVVGPILSYELRPALPDPTYAVASVDQLFADPMGMFFELTFTGYYPAVLWLSYVLAGLALGRLALGSPRVAATIAAAGAVLAAVTWTVSWWVVQMEPVRTALQDSVPADAPGFGGGLDVALAHGLYGNVPTTSWWWLATNIPHSTTPLDLLHTIGSGMVVLGLALLAGQQWPRLLGTVFAAGTMTLTLYSLHVIVLSAWYSTVSLEDVATGASRMYWIHVVGALLVGALWRAALGQGPLERLVAGVSKLGSMAVLALPDRERVRSAP